MLFRSKSELKNGAQGQAPARPGGALRWKRGDPGVRPSGRLSSLGDPWGVRAPDGPERPALTGTLESEALRAPEPHARAF